MRHFYALTLFAALAPGLALAQVSVNPAALQQLAGIEPPPPVTVPVTRPVASVAAMPHKAAHPHSQPAAPRPPAILPATAHVVPPPKPAPAPAPPAAPAPPKIIAPVTLTFAPGSADLPAGAAAALKPLCAASGPVSIDAHAPTDPTDPSGAMRLSLARAMAVQAALSGCGVPPQNLLPRALGNVPGQNENAVTAGSGIK